MKLAHITVGLLALGAIGFLAGPTSAAVNPNKPKILLHVKAVTTKNQCNLTPLVDNCANVVTRGELYPPVFRHIQLIVDRGDSIPMENGMAGVQFGINYPEGPGAISVFAWSLSATLEFTSTGWPASGGGNLITWNSVGSCQFTRIACAGYFYMGAYGPATFRVIKRPVDNTAKVADCGSVETIVPEGALGFAAFSSGAVTEGCNPCLVDCAPVAVVPTTWSKVKNLLD